MIKTLLSDFINKNMGIRLHTCDICKANLELVIEKYEIDIEGKIISIDKLPQLKCTKCGEKYLTEKSKGVIVASHSELINTNQVKIIRTFNHKNITYPFCTKYNFKYDYVDYEHIPGLTAMTGDGFLTPVFFKKSALIYFMYNPAYEFNLFSETYGTIRYKDEFIISFGINRNDRVVMWLGDLENLNDDTLLFLISQNIDSDHTLIDSEFYYGQMCCVFSDPIKEKQIVNLRNKLYDLLKIKYNLDLHSLDEEIIGVLNDVIKPISYSELEVKPVLSALHKIIIEAVNISNFKEFYISNVEKSKKNNKGWGSIKYYEFLLLHVYNKQSMDEQLKELISPLYLLNDLRILYSHIISIEVQSEKEKNITNCLKIESFNDTENLYKNLIDKLYKFFECVLKKMQ